VVTVIDGGQAESGDQMRSRVEQVRASAQALGWDIEIRRFGDLRRD
jgi:hypothetical protein